MIFIFGVVVVAFVGLGVWMIVDDIQTTGTTTPNGWLMLALGLMVAVTVAGDLFTTVASNATTECEARP